MPGNDPASLKNEAPDCKIQVFITGQAEVWSSKVATYLDDVFSGAHINPAITIGLLVAGEIEPILAVLYVGVQIAGGVTGALCMRVQFTPVLRHQLIIMQ